MEVVILLLVVVIVVLAALAGWEGIRLHRLNIRLTAAEAVPKPLSVDAQTATALDAALKAAYEAKITEATATFGVDLSATSKRLSEQVSRLTTSVIEEELTAYQKTLEEVRQSATAAMEQIRLAVEDQRQELRAGMQADLSAERERLTAKFDTKMGDIVAAYVAESLGTGVDLGAQLQSIVMSLEAHKDDLKKELSGVV